MLSNPTDVLVQHIRRLAGTQITDARTDRDLLRRFATAGDNVAFATLVSRHGPMVLRVCRHILGNSHDAEDAFQATFLVLARKSTGLFCRESLAGWLHEVASRVSCKALTAACRRRTHEALVECRPAPAAPEGEITVREARAVLNEELDRLPDRLRTPLVLCYLEGLTQDQAACRAGWTLSTFKRRMRQGKNLLHLRLRRRDVSLTAVLPVVTLLHDTRSVSATLLEAATRGARLFWAGLAPRAETSRAAALAEELRKTIFLHRLRNAGVLLIAGALTVGGGLAAQVLAMPRARPQTSVTARPNGQVIAEPAHVVQPVCLGTFGDHRGLNAAAVSPDGKTLASAGNDCRVKLWDLDARKELRTLLAEGNQDFSHDWQANSVAFSPDGKIVASGSVDRTIRLWDVTTGKKIAVLTGHQIFVKSLAFSPDGKFLASGSGGQPAAFKNIDDVKPLHQLMTLPYLGEVMVWDLATSDPETGRRRRTFFSRDTGRITSVTFSPDSKTLASGGWDGTVRLWDVGTGKERACLREDEVVTAVGFSSDGKTVASASSPDPKMLAASPNRHQTQRDRVKLWDMTSNQVRVRLKGHTDWVQAVAFSPDGRILATASSGLSRDIPQEVSGEIRLWNPATAQPIGGPLTCPHSGSSLAFGAGGKILVAAGPRVTDSGQFTVWALETPRLNAP
jgi:RNA polymerase sigma factor (sigma-70 family)